MSIPPQLPPGAVLADRFVIEAPVGAGGMAVVYRARDLTTQNLVAVKFLHGDTRSQFVLQHFRREAEILAALRHPRIVSYVSQGRVPEGPAYLVMEWLAGEDLSQRLTRGPLRLSETLQLASLVAEALEATHEQSIVHRDPFASSKVPPPGVQSPRLSSE